MTDDRASLEGERLVAEGRALKAVAEALEPGDYHPWKRASDAYEHWLINNADAMFDALARTPEPSAEVMRLSAAKLVRELGGTYGSISLAEAIMNLPLATPPPPAVLAERAACAAIAESMTQEAALRSVPVAQHYHRSPSAIMRQGIVVAIRARSISEEG